MKKDKKQTAATQSKSDEAIHTTPQTTDTTLIDESAAQTEQVQPAQETAAAEKNTKEGANKNSRHKR